MSKSLIILPRPRPCRKYWKHSTSLSGCKQFYISQWVKTIKSSTTL